jgi:subfamily B ATP-binding cassette protein MsbA
MSSDSDSASKPKPKLFARLRREWNTSMPHILRLSTFMRPYWKRWVAGLVLGSIYGAWAAGLIPALKFTLESFEQRHTSPDLWHLVAIGCVVPLYFVIRAALSYTSTYFSVWVGQRVLFDLKCALFAHLQKLSLDYFANARSARLIVQVTQRTKFAQNTLNQIGRDAVSAPITIIGVLWMMIAHDAFFTMVALGFIPVSLIPALILGSVVRRTGRGEEKASAGSVAILQENLLGVRTVKAYARSGYESGRFNEASSRELQNALRNKKYTELVGPSIEVLGSVGFGAAVIYGVRSQMPISTLISLAGGLFILYEPFKKLSRLWVTVQRVASMLEGLFEILDTRPSVAETEGARQLTSIQGRMELKHVTLSYVTKDGEEAGEEELVETAPAASDEHSRGAIDDVSLTFETGRFYALVGPSGAGKSSLLSLLMRFYDPQKGEILLDGVNIREIQTEALRNQMALVPQETFLFHDTIRANILYGRPGATEAEVEAAARQAYADEFIRHLPRGYDTVVGDRGCRFSGGQQQRLSLARAFLKNAPILLLDEATSALDAESAAKVQSAIDSFAKGRTVIAIAHRLSTIERADEIIVMERGRVAARGRHEVLMETSALYRRLNALQFGTESE